MNIYISNLSYRLKDEDLKSVFEEYGEVTSAKIITDKFSGRSKGFGFVEMPNDDEAQAAIDGLNGKELMGKVLTVNVAKPKTENNNRNRDRGDRGERRNFNRRY